MAAAQLAVAQPTGGRTASSTPKRSSERDPWQVTRSTVLYCVTLVEAYSAAGFAKRTMPTRRNPQRLCNNRGRPIDVGHMFCDSCGITTAQAPRTSSLWAAASGRVVSALSGGSTLGSGEQIQLAELNVQSKAPT